jgi:nitrate reductase gamma subunit
MSPTRKETAYLHLPTYISGLIYHLGTFISLFFVFLFLFGYYPSKIWSILLSAFLALSFLAGLFILVKRTIKRSLRLLSNPDDYISNILVTLLHGFVVITLLWHSFAPVLFVCASLLMLYIPLGKLKHIVYFFTSRIYLARFYGKRGVWPLENQER